MTWESIGESTLGAAIPLAIVVQAQLDTSLASVVPELTAKLAGFLSAQAALVLSPPTLATQLEAALGMVAQLEALVELGVPSASVDLSVIASMIADLTATLGSISGMVGFGALLTTPGIYLARHTAAVGDVFPAGLPGGQGPTQEVQGIGIFATDAASWTAMQAVFKVEP